MQQPQKEANQAQAPVSNSNVLRRHMATFLSISDTDYEKAMANKTIDTLIMDRLRLLIERVIRNTKQDQEAELNKTKKLLKDCDDKVRRLELDSEATYPQGGRSHAPRVPGPRSRPPHSQRPHSQRPHSQAPRPQAPNASGSYQSGYNQAAHPGAPSHSDANGSHSNGSRPQASADSPFARHQFFLQHGHYPTNIADYNSQYSSAHYDHFHDSYSGFQHETSNHGSPQDSRGLQGNSGSRSSFSYYGRNGRSNNHRRHRSRRSRSPSNNGGGLGGQIEDDRNTRSRSRPAGSSQRNNDDASHPVKPNMPFTPANDHNRGRLNSGAQSSNSRNRDESTTSKSSSGSKRKRSEAQILTPCLKAASRYATVNSTRSASINGRNHARFNSASSTPLNGRNDLIRNPNGPTGNGAESPAKRQCTEKEAATSNAATVSKGKLTDQADFMRAAGLGFGKEATEGRIKLAADVKARDKKKADKEAAATQKEEGEAAAKQIVDEEAAAAKQRADEEAAAKKKADEEAAAKKKADAEARVKRIAEKKSREAENARLFRLNHEERNAAAELRRQQQGANRRLSNNDPEINHETDF